MKLNRRRVAKARASAAGQELELPQFERATHATLHEHAYGQIRQSLMTGRFLPGQKITIRGLASAFGISPTPIREAVRRLGAEGALQIESNRWMRVPLLSPQQLGELRAVRLALEGLATERAVATITPADIAELRAADATIRALREIGDTAGMIVNIHRFHHTIYAAARMPTLKHLIEGLWLRSGPYVNLLFTGYTVRERGRLRARILAAIVRRDAQAAREAMQADLGHALDYLIQFVGSDPAQVGRGGKSLPRPATRRHRPG